MKTLKGLFRILWAISWVIMIGYYMFGLWTFVNIIFVENVATLGAFIFTMNYLYKFLKEEERLAKRKERRN